jgi:hypothetical protein
LSQAERHSKKILPRVSGRPIRASYASTVQPPWEIAPFRTSADAFTIGGYRGFLADVKPRSAVNSAELHFRLPDRLALIAGDSFNSKYLATAAIQLTNRATNRPVELEPATAVALIFHLPDPFAGLVRQGCVLEPTDYVAESL